jgi:hypothetical protein
MTPKKQPSGRSEDTPQWTTATAARIDRIAEDLHRQTELVDVDTGTQNVHHIPQRAGAEIRSTHAQMHGGASNPQIGRKSAGASSSSSRPPSGIEPTAIPEGGDTGRPAEVIGTSIGRWEGAQPRELPQNPAEELAALRFASTRPQSFCTVAAQRDGVRSPCGGALLRDNLLCIVCVVVCF